MRDWTLNLKGGSFDGVETTYPKAEPILIAWRCHGLGCQGHFAFDVNHEKINLETAVAYKRTERDDVARVAVYEVGEDVPGEPLEREERELVPAGGLPGPRDVPYPPWS